MFTVCPKCSLKLVVTAADLRVAQGYVRCGRCSNVFNALVGLSDEQQAVLAQEERAAAAGEQPAAPLDAPADPAARTEEPISDAALEFDPVATDVSEVFVEPTLEADGSTGRSETIILRSEEEQPEDPSPATAHATDARPATDARAEESVHIALDSSDFEKTDEFELADLGPLLDLSAARPHSLAATTPTTVTSAATAPATITPVATTPAAMAPVAASPAPSGSGRSQASVVSPASSAPPADDAQSPTDTEVDSLSAAAPAARRFEGLAAIGSVVLALILAAQVVHHYRTRLADIDWLRSPLTAVYAALGMPLVPHWDVTAYEVRQLGAIAGGENSGALTVRASIKNTAAMRQPLPLLRVTVQDRFGNRVAARDVPPRAYLPGASAQRAYLAAGQRVDAEIALVDPGPSVVGFEIDACLEDAAGRVSCANEASDASRVR